MKELIANKTYLYWKDWSHFEANTFERDFIVRLAVEHPGCYFGKNLAKVEDDLNALEDPEGSCWYQLFIIVQNWSEEI